MTKHFCDRCKNELSLSENKKVHLEDVVKIQKDLCNICFISVVEFVNGKRQ